MAPFLENPVFQINYVQSLLILAAAIVASLIFTFLTKKVIVKLVKKSETILDDLIIEAVQKPVWYLIIIIGIKFALIPLGIYHERIDQIAFSLITLIIIWLATRIVDALIDGWGKEWASKTKSTIDDELLPLFHKASKFILWLIGLMIVLKHWGVEIGPLLTSLGIAGIAIGFAVKDSLSNIFGGISLLIDKTYKVGDVIKLQSGVAGVVMDIGLRSTRIKTADHQVVIVPNGNIAVSNVENWVQPTPAIRVTIDFSVEYGSDIEKVKNLVLDLLNKDKRVSKNFDRLVFFRDLGESALVFSAYFFVDNISMKMSVEDEMRTKIYNALNKAKIGMPFPTRTVYLKKSKK